METNEMSAIYGKENVKITCIERRYKVASPRMSFIISAKKELDEDVTKRLLHEDMELKTFLANYEITNIVFPSIIERDKIEREKNIKEMFEREKNIKEMSEREKNIKIEDGNRLNLAKLPTSLQREYVVMSEMPDEFCLHDIIDFYKKRGETYDIPELRSHFSRTLQQLKKLNKIEIANPEANPRNKRYRKLITNKDEIDNMYKSLKEGHKAILGTIK